MPLRCVRRYKCLSLVLESSAFVVTSYAGFPWWQMGGHGRREERSYKGRKISVVVELSNATPVLALFAFCERLEGLPPKLDDLILILHRNRIEIHHISMEFSMRSCVLGDLHRESLSSVHCEMFQ
jgi:hypothetical protein